MLEQLQQKKVTFLRVSSILYPMLDQLVSLYSSIIDRNKDVGKNMFSLDFNGFTN